jgi:CRP-like cAMP-binding protein
MITSNVALKGSISFLDLGELLQLLGGSGSTGILKLIRGQGERIGYIYIIDGNPVDAEFEDIKGQAALNDFFGWLDAEFEFYNEKILRRRSISKNRMELILDGLRMLDDGLIEKLGQSAPQKVIPERRDESGVPIIKGPLVDYLYIVDEDEFSQGQEIVAQEKFGNWLWVILEGTVEVVRVLPEGRAPINKLTEGAFIGSINALKKKRYVRSATVTAITDVQLGVLDFHRILEEYSKISPTLQDVFTSIENRLVQITTGCTKAYLRNDRLVQNTKDLVPLAYPENGYDKIRRITKGQAVVVKPLHNQKTHLCLLKPGDFIGDISFLNTSHEPHSADVYASDDLETETIDLIDLKEGYDELSDAMKNMVQHTANCLSVTSGRLMEILKNAGTAE